MPKPQEKNSRRLLLKTGNDGSRTSVNDITHAAQYTRKGYTGSMKLSDLLALHFRLSEFQRRALKKLHIQTIRDLLYHLPVRYESTSDMKSIAGLGKGDEAILTGTISGLKMRKAWRRKTPIAEGWLTDGTGRIKIIWFNQPYLAKMVTEGATVKVTGKITGTPGKLYVANPAIENASALSSPEGPLFKNGDDSVRRALDAKSYTPVYPESRGVTSLWFFHAIKKVFASGVLDAIEDPIPEATRRRYNLPSLSTALVWIHTPRRGADAVAARKRFAFEEVFLIQLAKQQDRKALEANKSVVIDPSPEAIEEFIGRFPFTPTGAQRRAIMEIFEDFARGKPMARLLEGDVGSGKTAVAAATAYAAVVTSPKDRPSARLQVAYMAPTEILTKQHFESFIAFFRHMPVNIGLITGSGCKKFPSKVSASWQTGNGVTDISRTQLLKWVASGEIPILIGTHALIQKSVKFKDLAYVVIDEQHRFGTGQRKELVRKDNVAPHLLSMTATPIPRSLALTVYGDLDLSLLDELPAGRRIVQTQVVLPKDRERVYEKVREELASGRQAYVICPRIDEPDPAKELALQAKSVKAECARLKKEVFPEERLDTIHSKMKPGEKDDVMARFLAHDIDILVATSVVEVGVNVPNATVIIIEGAERFGLAQLHQLRGRVQRSTYQPHCFAFIETASASARLKAFEKSANGFELAEKDLELRGAGELYGRKQWGLSDVAMEALKNMGLVKAAREEAHALIQADAELRGAPHLALEVARKRATLHFE